MPANVPKAVRAEEGARVQKETTVYSQMVSNVVKEAMPLIDSPSWRWDQPKNSGGLCCAVL